MDAPPWIEGLKGFHVFLADALAALKKSRDDFRLPIPDEIEKLHDVVSP